MPTTSDTAVSRDRPIVVLVAGDWAVVNALTFVLETEGCYVTAFTSGEAALQRDVSAAACLVIDETLRGSMGAAELIDELRAKGVATPIILMAAHPDEKTLHRAAADGTVVVEKPLLGAQFSNAVLTALKRHSA